MLFKNVAFDGALFAFGLELHSEFEVHSSPSSLFDSLLKIDEWHVLICFLKLAVDDVESESYFCFGLHKRHFTMKYFALVNF